MQQNDNGVVYKTVNAFCNVTNSHVDPLKLVTLQLIT